jgi:hypothetical protein
MRVGEAVIATPPPPIPEPAPTPSKPRRRKRRTDPSRATAIWDGLIAKPKAAETSLRESLLYPLWGGTGVAALVILTPPLWFTSILVVGGLSAVSSGNGGPPALMGLLMSLPAMLGLFAVLGYALLFLGRVLAVSALGEVHHPRWPDWELSMISFGLGRWLWAGLMGGVVGVVPAIAYWTTCGDLDLFDLIILGELLAVGAVYGLMALLASVLHEDIVAANPFTVFSAIWTIGWDYLPSCLVAGFSVMLAGMVGMAAFEVENPAFATFLAWLFWVVALYAGMVTLRVLGLCYARHARELGWFRGRTGWRV